MKMELFLWMPLPIFGVRSGWVKTKDYGNNFSRRRFDIFSWGINPLNICKYLFEVLWCN
jgi:hypothetical protein